MVEQRRLLPRRRSVAQNHLLALLTRQLDDLVPGEWRALDVVDLGGGTGGMAIPLAARGHQVRVVDPSPDALAALERRTAEAGLTGRIAGLQGDAAELASLIGERQADVVVCHRVLEVVDDPGRRLGRHGRHAATGGVLSLLVAQRQALVLSQALAGHLGAGPPDATPIRHRFDQARVLELVQRAGFTVLASHGIGAIADLVPERLLETEPGAYEDSPQLEAEISSDPAFRALAPQLHVFAQAQSLALRRAWSLSCCIEQVFEGGDMADRCTADHHARRHGRLLRLGRAAPPPRAARHPGDRRRVPARGRAVGQLRGPGLRRTVGHAVRSGAPAGPAGDLRRARTSTATARCPRRSSRSSRR